MRKDYYAMQNPEVMLNGDRFNRSIIKSITFDKNGIEAEAILSFPLEVGAIFHVLNDCDRKEYLVWCHFGRDRRKYTIRKKGSEVFTAEDFIILKPKAIIFKTGFFYS